MMIRMMDQDDDHHPIFILIILIKNNKQTFGVQCLPRAAAASPWLLPNDRGRHKIKIEEMIQEISLTSSSHSKSSG